jgi:hypothetical protein
MALKQNREVSVIRMGDGSRVLGLDVASLDWELRLNKEGGINVDSRIAAHEVSYQDVIALTTPKKYGLALDVNNELAEAGQIASRTFSDDGKTMSLQAPGVWAYLELLKVHKVSFNFATDDPKLDDVTFSGMSWRGIAGAILMAVVNNPHNIEEVPPFVCDFAGEAGTKSMTYLGADFTTVAEALKALTEVSGGPDLALIPEWVDAERTRLQWRLTGGQPLLMQDGDPEVIDSTVTDSGLTGLGVDEDGSGVATRVWATGADGVIVGTNTLLAESGYPLMEVNEEFEVANLAELDVELGRKLVDSSATMSTWSLKTRVDDVLNNKPGDFLNVVTKGYRAIEDGTRLVRVVGINGDASSKVTYHLQPLLTTWENFDPSEIQRSYHEPDPVRAEVEVEKATKAAISRAAKSGGSGSGDDGGSGGAHNVMAAKVLVGTNGVDLMVIVQRLGMGEAEPEEAENHTGRTLVAGDRVDIAIDTVDGLVVLGKGLAGDGTFDQMVAAVRYRTYPGFPIPVWEQGIPFGSTHEDPEDIEGYGEGNLAIDAQSADKAFFNPTTGVTHGMVPPQGFGFLANGTHLWGGQRLHWFLSAGGQPYLFRKAGVEPGGWQLVSGLPTSPDKLTTGIWDATSFSSEVYDPPKVVTVRTTSSTFVGNTVPMIIDIKVYDEATGDFKTFSVNYSAVMGSNTSAYWNGRTIYTSFTVKTPVWGEAGTIMFELAGDSFGSSGYSVSASFKLANTLLHFDTATQVLTNLGTAMTTYLGTASGVRVSYDGTAYSAPASPSSNQALIYERKLNENAPRSMQYSAHPYAASAAGGAQRIGASSRYMIAHRAPIPGGTSGQWTNGLGEVTEVDFDMGTSAVIVPRATVTGTTGYTPAQSAIPRELPDGSIMVHMYNGHFATKSTNIVYRIIPDPFGAQ